MPLEEQLPEATDIRQHWYTHNPSAPFFYISAADDLAELAAIVNGTADGIARDDFSGRTIMLIANIDLSDHAEGEGWIPIGIFPADAF